MSRSITLAIPEKEVSSFERALDEAIAELRGMENDESREREERIVRLRAETHVLMEQIRKELHVEKSL
jgi:hypothetical protein